METQHIEELLERYLSLLDEYTTLREALNKSQAALYRSIAQANFSADRGFRYGQDCYDERMKATRTLEISESSPREEGLVEFKAIRPREGESAKTEDSEKTGEDGGEGDGEGEVDDDVGTSASQKGEKAEGGEGEAPSSSKDDEDAATAVKPKDPLRWFGVLTPMPLRQAQTEAVVAVEEVIPRLVTVNCHMAEIEIQIRRARKKRAKAEAAAAAAAKDKVGVAAGETVKTSLRG